MLAAIRRKRCGIVQGACYSDLRIESARTITQLPFDGFALGVFTDTNIPVGASRADVIRLMSEVLLRLPLTPFAYTALCVPMSYRGLRVPIRRFAKVAPRQNCVVHVWTINDPTVAAKLWLDGVQGIVTDDPAIMLRARERLSVPSPK